MSNSRNRSFRRPGLGRHQSAVSVDTNASGMAESTISLGQISSFPEPPTSIPNSPLLLNFENSRQNSPTTSTTPSLQVPIHSRRLPQPPTVHARYPNPGQSFTPPKSTPQHHNPSPTSASQSQPPPSSFPRVLSAYDWHDGASSIDVDDTEERLLPTSLITSLLQENKPNRNSVAASEAFSGISEITYPPIADRRRQDAQPSSFHPPQNRTATPASSLSQQPGSSKRRSADSETLASMGNYPIVIRAASRAVRAPGPHLLSTVSSMSSMKDAETLRGADKSSNKALYTTYELGEESFDDYKGYNNTAYPSGFFGSDQARQERRALPETPQVIDRARRASLQSSKSGGSFLSRVSKGLSLRKLAGKKSAKPLPPVPMIPHISYADEQAYRKLEESSPLPDLINRAGALREMLETGLRPHTHSSPGQSPAISHRTPSYHPSSAYDPTSMHDVYDDEVKYEPRYQAQHTPTAPYMAYSQQISPRHPVDPKRKRRLFIIIPVIIALVLATVAIPVGVVLSRKAAQSFNCEGGMTGTTCTLNATCVCTSTAQCNGLAQSIMTLLPVVNDAFNANFTPASAYSNFWLMQGSPSANNCASQALVMDVGKNLDHSSFPNRTQWVQAALLWNVLQTQDIASGQKMQKFVQALPWKSLSNVDAPTSGQESGFTMKASGYSYNFASQTVTQPPGSFVSLGQPPNAEIQRVSTNAQATLDKMYTFAQASSIQRQTALQKYWTSVLLQRADSLATFKSAISVSPVMMPFNASSGPIRNLYTSSPSSPFPPPLSCYPALNPPLQQQLNMFESMVFGLPNVTSATKFDPTCYRDRPIYGVLDILHLRLPFRDDRTGVVQQAAVLRRDAQSRVVLYSGEVFSATFNGPASIASSQLDPRQYGTSSFLDHVVLQYLTSIPDISVANALVNFVLDSATKVPVPPAPTSILYQSLNTLPTIEVAVFGDVGPADLSSTAASFTTSSGLFFGSDDGNALRTWTINGVQAPVVWTQNATSPLVVRDSSLGDNTITQTWNAISLAIVNKIPNIGLPNITTTLTGTQNFAP